MMRGQARGLRLDQEIAPRRRLDLADFLEDAPARPAARCCRNSSECCQYLSSWSGTSPSSASQPTPARHHVVHQPRQIVGQRQRRGRAADHQRRCRSPGSFGPRRDQLRQQSAGAAVRPAQAEFPAAPRRHSVRPLRRTPVRPRRCRRARRCAAAPRHRSSTRRERSPAPSVRRAGSADKASPAPAFPDCARASKPSTSRPSTSAAMTVRRNGTETGTLKTRMGFLIRRSGCIMARAAMWREGHHRHSGATRKRRTRNLEIPDSLARPGMTGASSSCPALCRASTS